MQGGAEDIEEHILSLHTEMYDSGEVTSEEEEHDEASKMKRTKPQKPRTRCSPATSSSRYSEGGGETQQVRSRQRKENLQNNRRMKM